jgi:hypothetical protein
MPSTGRRVDGGWGGVAAAGCGHLRTGSGAVGHRAAHVTDADPVTPPVGTASGRRRRMLRRACGGRGDAHHASSPVDRHDGPWRTKRAGSPPVPAVGSHRPKAAGSRLLELGQAVVDARAGRPPDRHVVAVLAGVSRPAPGAPRARGRAPAVLGDAPDLVHPCSVLGALRSGGPGRGTRRCSPVQRTSFVLKQEFSTAGSGARDLGLRSVACRPTTPRRCAVPRRVGAAPVGDRGGIRVCDPMR